MFMKQAISIILFSALFTTSCGDGKKIKQETVSRFNWLNGSWAMKEKDGTVTEQWMQVNDSLMKGSSDFIKGDSVIPFETIRMFRSGNDFYYEAKAAGQNNEQPVAFKLTSFSDTGFVAENPQHDFPKRITYRLVNKDSIHAFIDGGAAMPDKRADFYYSRNKN
jgi:hypothetical protein